MTVTPGLVAILLVLVNVWTFFAYWLDKIRARNGDRRTPEKDLLGLAIIGGSPAALIACHLLRHKTRKQPFASFLLVVIAVQAALGAWLFYAGRTP